MVKRNSALVVLFAAMVLTGALAGVSLADDDSKSAKSQDSSKGMVKIPAGCFQMGSTYMPEDEKPVHKACLDSFHIDVHEVSLGDYLKCAEAQRKALTDEDRKKACEPPDYDDYEKTKPVVGVSWWAAKKYCEWAGKRLPTEAEWEYAARGGVEGKMYPWGEMEVTTMAGAPNGANYGRGDSSFENGEPLKPVGSFGANGFGIYDMAGNVYEWVADWYDAGYYAKSPEKNPKGPKDGKVKVLRGGSWMSSGLESLRVADRASLDPNYGLPEDGFRCAK